MAKRKIIEIDEGRCTGCGACVTGCPEGALAVLGGKARVVNEVFCDGLGACVGMCPEGALRIVERDAPGFDERAVKDRLSRTEVDGQRKPEACGCPSHEPVLLRSSRGSHSHNEAAEGSGRGLPSQLVNWPVQWRLVRPDMPFFKDADVLICADCVPFAFSDFHGSFLLATPVVIGSPKLDDQQGFLERLTDLARDSGLKSICVVHMEVPCCHGLRKLVEDAVRESGREIPVRTKVVGIRGDLRDSP